MTTNPGADAPAILLSLLPTGAGAEIPLGLEGMPTEISVKIGTETKKIPVSYWEKDTIPCGEFKHSITGQPFAVTQQDMEQFVSKFDAMRAAGIEIPCPADHSDKAEDNRGFAIKMRRDGNRLRVTQQVFGDDGALLAARNRCSIKINPNFIDETGKNWGRVIEHVAFTPIPVISGQGPFVPIAASRGQQSAVYYLSASKGPLMDFTPLRTSLGAANDVADEKLIELAITKIADGNKAATDLADVQTKLTASEAKVVSLSRTPAPADPEVMLDRADNYVEKIELSVAKGEMPMEFAKKLTPMAKQGDKPNVFMLSRHADINARPLDLILDLFKGEKFGIAAGEVTPIQLNREVPDQVNFDPKTDRQMSMLQEQTGAK